MNKTVLLLLIIALVSICAFGQTPVELDPGQPAAFAPPAVGSPIDLSGGWFNLPQEDGRERRPGPALGDYSGVPLNDAGRMRADTYDSAWWSKLELQCRPHPTGYVAVGPDALWIEKEIDPFSRKFVGYRIFFQRDPGQRMIYLDGRPHPSENYPHTWDGFSTGKWEGDTLIITTTHLKESFLWRNGIDGSFRRTVTEYIFLDEPYLTWTMVTVDPDYLTAPLIINASYVRDPHQTIPPYACTPRPEDEAAATKGRKDFVPHWLPGKNPYLTDTAREYKFPIEATRGGAEQSHPDYQKTLAALMANPRPLPAMLEPVYTDESTRIAERADAQPVGAPNFDNAKLELLHVQGNVHMLAGAGGNITLSVGGDGIFMVDSGAAQMTEKVLATVQQAAERFASSPPPLPNSSSWIGSRWQYEHSLSPPPIRMIINTTVDPAHTGGNEKIVAAKSFESIRGGESILAHENLLKWQIEAGAPEAAQPSDTYFAERYRMHRYFNGEGVEVIYLPAAITDGDSMVYFRSSNVISTGDVFNSETYPPIDVDKGGSVQGVIDALIRITDLAYPDYSSQAGTMIIPGHGRLCDESEVAYYRDMIIIIRDRIQDMIKRGMTLQQVKAAKPTMDYDPLFGRQPGATPKFVEAVYRSLSEKR